MKSRGKLFRGIVNCVYVLGAVALLTGSLFAKGQEQGKEHSLVQVESKYVCMVNNQRFEKEQIAIQVKDRTYYGCCEMCKEKLRTNAKSRVATDPVSGKEVDKATAVIGASTDGKVFYFENVENLKKYRVE